MKQLLAVLVLLLSVQPVTAGSWYPVIIHVHTIFSDGGKTPEEVVSEVLTSLAKAGYNGKCVIVVCDHFDGVARSFSTYAAAIRAASNDRVIMIPGLELGSKWHPEPNTVAVSHMLAIGNLPPGYKSLLGCYDLNTSGSGLPLLDRFNMQQKLIDKVLELGMMPVAAHPSQMLSGINIARSDNRFNTKADYNGLRAVEVMNNLGPGQDQECVDFYLRLVQLGLAIFVTAGSDYHGTTVSSIPDSVLGSLERVTWVYADDFSQESIIRAISEGKTYAAANGAKFDCFLQQLGQNPSLGVVGVDEVRIPVRCTLAGSDVAITIYRNGLEVFKQRFDGSLISQRSYGFLSEDNRQFEWCDREAERGKIYRYIVRVVAKTKSGKQTQLITSPITLMLRPEGLTESFFRAIESNDMVTLTSLLSSDKSLANSRRFRGSLGELALTVACQSGSLGSVRLLLENGADPDGYLICGEIGPLMQVAGLGDLEKAKLLLEHKASPSICTDGNSPLTRAISCDHADLAKFLIEHGASFTQVDDNGVSPLKLSREHGQEEISKLLLEKGAKE